MIVIIILCSVVFALFMSVVTTYVDTQTDINQAKENAKPYTYQIVSVVKSKNETFINTDEGVQFVIDPSDPEWLEYKGGDTISVTYGQSKPDQKGRVVYAYTITNKTKSNGHFEAPPQTKQIDWNTYQKPID